MQPTFLTEDFAVYGQMDTNDMKAALEPVSKRLSAIDPTAKTAQCPLTA